MGDPQKTFYCFMSWKKIGMLVDTTISGLNWNQRLVFFPFCTIIPVLLPPQTAMISLNGLQFIGIIHLILQEWKCFTQSFNRLLWLEGEDEDLMLKMRYRLGTQMGISRTYHIKGVHLAHSRPVCVVVLLDNAVRKLRRKRHASQNTRGLNRNTAG